MAFVMTEKLLKRLDYLPEKLLDSAPHDVQDILGAPTLIELNGRETKPLFISVLLHGNEPTGFYAVQALLNKYQDKTLPRSLALFFGNVAAASQERRRLDGQADYNRVWPGTPMAECAETRMAADIVDIMRQKNVFASVDIHNNTGLNPHYSCVNVLKPPFLQLANLFGRFVVYFIHPKGVQSAAFAQLCPAVTLECGRPGQAYGVEHAFEFIDGCLNMASIPDHAVHHQDLDLFHTVAQITVDPDIDFSFDRQDASLVLNGDLETFNFTEVPAGTVIGQYHGRGPLPIQAQDERGQIVTERFFYQQGADICISRDSMPSMLTLDKRVIRQDCLCYLMERITPDRQLAI